MPITPVSPASKDLKKVRKEEGQMSFRTKIRFQLNPMTDLDLVSIHVDAICAKIASGISMRAACESDPAFPTFPSFQTRCTRDPVIRAKYLAAKSLWSVNRKLTWLVHFDAIMRRVEQGESILEALASCPEFPSYQTFSTVLKARRDLAERYRQASRKRQAGPNARSRGADYTRAEIDRAITAVPRLREGSGHHSKVTAGGPHVATLKYHADRSQALATELRAAYEKRSFAAAAERNVENAQRSARSFDPLAQALKQNPIYSAALAAVPRGMDPDVKADVVADICCAVAAGELLVGNISKRAREFIAAHYRNFSPHKFTSLDAPSAWDPDVSIVDTLTTGEW